MEDQTAWIDEKGTVHRLTLRLAEVRCLHCKYDICVQDFTTREDREPIVVHGVGYEEIEGSWEVLQYSNHLVVCMTDFKTPESTNNVGTEQIGYSDRMGRIRLHGRGNSAPSKEKLVGRG